MVASPAAPLHRNLTGHVPYVRPNPVPLMPCPTISTHSARLGGLLLLGLAAIPALAALADRFTFDVPREGEERMEATLSLSLGTIEVGAAPAGRLITAEIELDDDRLVPALDTQRRGNTARVRLGFEEGTNTSVSWRGLRNRSRNHWIVGLSREIPLDLTFDLGLAEVDMDLTGLRVERLNVSAGMSTTRLAFAERNPVVMSHLAVDAGASRFTAEGLGNARFERLSFTGGAGSFTLDFNGAHLPAGARADIDVGVSRLRIMLPDDKAVVLHAPDSWLTRVDVPNGYTRASRGVWHSAHVREASEAFHMHINAGMGRVICETVARH